MQANVISLGCRLNLAEGDAIAAMAGDRAITVVNSCAVTAEAVRQTRQAIRQAWRQRPDVPVIVTGCAAQTDAAAFDAMPEVSAVVANDRKLDAASILALAPPIAKPEASATPAQRARTRGFAIVQNGCDHQCTFCIIPAGRGASRSIAPDAVIADIARMVDSGVQEVVLTGVDLTSYGDDGADGLTLGHLVSMILSAVPALPRLRLSSLDGVEIDDRLFDLLTGEPRVMPHVHLSLQAGDDMILKRMKRRHDRRQAIELVQRLHARRPDIAIGADIIAGFPTETEEMFAHSLALVSDCRIVHGHVFPYSPRPGTPAARMPAVDPAIVKDRARRLRDACQSQRQAWLAAQTGNVVDILLERSGIDGHAANFAPVRLNRPSRPGTIVRATVNGVENGRLLAQEIGHG